MAVDARPGPHLLYVAWGFPPSRSGGVHRAIATVNAFVRAGWAVTVLTAPADVIADLTGTDETLESLVDTRVSILRVPFDWPAKQTDVRAFSAARVLFPRLWVKTRARRDMLGFPEAGYGPWRKRIEEAALAVHARRPVDLVMGTTNPHVDVTPGVRLHKEYGIPHVVDCRDAWTLLTYSGTRVHEPGSAIGRWEAKAFGSAAEIWFVNEPLRRWHARAYPGDAQRMHVVMNGYDADLPLPDRSAASSDRSVRFGYIGTLTLVMPVREFVEGWQYGRAHEPLLSGAQAELYGHLGYFATPYAAITTVIDEGGDAGLRYSGPIPKADVAAAYASFDVLVLILGGGEFVTSGKVFEYMSTGLPIVSVLTPGNAAADVLGEYPRWHPAPDLTPAGIASALAAGAADALGGDDAQAAAAQDAARKFRRDRQLEPRIEALQRLVSEGRLPPDATAPGATAPAGGTPG